MVDLRVIEGSGSPEEREAAYAEALAAEAFEALVIEVLRAVGRGPDNSYRVIDALKELYGKWTAGGVRFGPPIRAGVLAVHERLLPSNEDPYDAELRYLLSCALRLTAERLATDGFAKGRASQREDDFRRALESYLLEKEERTRHYGGSYLTSLLSRLPPLPPPKRTTPRKPTKRKKTKARPSASAER